VELINGLRPTLGIAQDVTFAALALHQYSGCRQKLEAGADDYVQLFVHEVRRSDPFFPFVAGRVRNGFDWRGYHFARGTWVLLDL
jgi:fatty-acid peroxygenase